VPTTCEAEGKSCDLISDGCGELLDCGSCSGFQSCGGGGEPNVCGCPALVTVEPHKATHQGVVPLFPGQILAQSFVSPDAIDLVSIRLEGAYTPLAAGGHITLSLYTDVGAEPDAGTLLATKTFSIASPAVRPRTVMGPAALTGGPLRRARPQGPHRPMLDPGHSWRRRRMRPRMRQATRSL